MALLVMQQDILRRSLYNTCLPVYGMELSDTKLKLEISLLLKNENQAIRLVAHMLFYI